MPCAIIGKTDSAWGWFIARSSIACGWPFYPYAIDDPLVHRRSKTFAASGNVDAQALRAPRANRDFCTDMGKNREGLGLVYYKIVDCVRMAVLSVRDR